MYMSETTNPARLLVVGRSCYVYVRDYQLCRATCSGKQLVCMSEKGNQPCRAACKGKQLLHMLEMLTIYLRQTGKKEPINEL